MVNYLWENLFRRASRDQEVEKILTENYIFKALSKTELVLLRELVHVRTYKPSEVIFSQGELGVGMYILLTGTVDITVEDLNTAEQVRRDVFVTRLSRGDFFGEISLVEAAGRRTATATAADDVTLIGFFKPDLSEIIERNPRMAVKILNQLSEVLGRRLKETADRFAEVKRELKELGRQNGNP